MSKQRSGIYAIVNNTNGKRYVGSTTEFRNRWRHHRADLRGNRHGNKHLQAAWNLYGEKAFEFIIVEYVAPDALLDVEQKHLDGNGDGYNIAIVAGASNRGRQLSEEHRVKIALAGTGRKHSEESKAKMSAVKKEWWAANEAYKLSEEHKAKLRAAHKRRRAAGIKPRKCSEETKRKIGAANRGHKWSQEQKARLSMALKGRKFSDEHRAKIGAAQKGCKRKPLSDEHRAKIAATQKRRSAARRKVNGH